MTGSPSAEIREAARLMRERATLVPPPPWHQVGCQVNTDDPGDVIAQSGLPDRALVAEVETALAGKSAL